MLIVAAMSYLAEVLASTPQKVLSLQQRTSILNCDFSFFPTVFSPIGASPALSFDHNMLAMVGTRVVVE
jgi:hypothetical protein